MRKSRFLFLMVCALVAQLQNGLGLHAQPTTRPLAEGPPCVTLPPEEVKFEQEIIAYEYQDSVQFPDSAEIVFTGSSSIRRWECLKRDMGNLPVINRGFGGSMIHHVAHFADRMILPYRPKVIVFYAGENDLSKEEISPEMALDNYRKFVDYVHYHLPECRILYMSMKPSPARWEHWSKFVQGNKLIQAYIEEEEDSRLEYIDISEVMLDGKGQPKADIFVKDRLHMNDRGYRLWTEAVRPRLEQCYGEACKASSEASNN